MRLDRRVAALALLLPLAAFSEEPRKTGPLAGSVVRSDRWTVRQKLGQEEFTGNVSYLNDGRVFKSDWALWDKNNGIFETRGHSYGSRKEPTGELLEAWSERGRYEFDDRSGRAWSEDGSGVRIKRTSADGQILSGTGRTAIWSSFPRQLTLEENVHMSGSSETARSESAVYRIEENTLTLTAGPPIVEFRGARELGALQAEEVELHPDEGRLVAKRRVHGWVHWAGAK